MIRGLVAVVAIAVGVVAAAGGAWEVRAQSMLGQSVPGQGPRVPPPGLTPLGPVQAPLNAPPAMVPVQGARPAIEAEPLPPVVVPAPVVQVPALVAPPVVQAPVVQAPAVQAPAVQAPVVQAPAVQAPAVQAPVVQAPAAVVPGVGERDWVSRPGVGLQGLDKVTARVTALSARVGESIRFGSLSIVVRSCVVRPGDVAADAAAFVEVTERGVSAPVFRGWMLVSNPGLGVIEHPVYDVRLAGCRA
jgi:hypothetical protein